MTPIPDETTPARRRSGSAWPLLLMLLAVLLAAAGWHGWQRWLRYQATEAAEADAAVLMRLESGESR